MKKLLLIIALIFMMALNVLAQEGTYSPNDLFYKPDYLAHGTTEWEEFNDYLDIADQQIEDNKDNSFATIDTEAELEAAITDVTDFYTDNDFDIDDIGMLDESETVTGYWYFQDYYTVTRSHDTAAAAPLIFFNRSRTGTTIVQDDDWLGEITFKGYDGGLHRSGSAIRAVVDGTPGSSDMPGRLEFLTTPDGDSASDLRMAIDNAGNIKMGDGVWTNYINIDSSGDLTLEGTSTIEGVDATEFDYLEGVTSDIQTQLDAKIEATLTQAEVEDFVGGMLGGTETFITVTYQDETGDIDFVVPVKDEDEMTSDSDTYLATQQSIKAYVDAEVAGAGGGTMSSFYLEDGDGTEVEIDDADEVKFIDGSIMDINWTDTDNGTDADPFDLTFTLNTAAVTDDDTTHVPTCDNVYEFCETTQAYLQNVVEDTTPELGGDLTSGDNNITGIGRASFTQEYDNGSKSANFTIDFNVDQKQKVTLTANTMTLTLDTTSVGVANYLLKIVNGGLATLTWAAETGSVYFPGGTDPELTSSGTDIVTFYFDGTNWYGMAGLDFK